MGMFTSENNTSCLGIDIGSAGVKIVELKKEGNFARLVSYGFNETKTIENKNEWKIEKERVAMLINEIRKRAGMKAKIGIASLPTFSVFSSTLNLSNIAQKDLGSAIQWEAKKVIPLPLEEMILDWKKIDETTVGSNKNTKVFLTGAPRSLVKKYIDIFKEANIHLSSIETETFSLIRSLVGGDKSPILILEIGSSTTDLCIVEKSMPVLTRSIDIGGLSITKAISNNLNISIERAEQFKLDMGVSLNGSSNDVIPKTIEESLSPIVNEIKYSLNIFETKNNTQIEKIILSGGSSLILNLPGYLTKILDRKVIIGNPWARISYPVELKPVLDEIGPRMAVAAGLALREMEK